MARATLRQRFFPLHTSDEVDRFLDRFARAALFKAGTSDKTFNAWLVAQKALEPRVDLPVGFVRLPEDRPASERIAAMTGVPHRSPQFILCERGQARFHLDEFAITPEELVPRLREHLPPEVGPPVRNEAIVTVEPYRLLLADFVEGRLPEERFQWAYLDRLEQDAAWRDDETFAVLNGLFENPDGRDLRAPRLVALEFQAQISGRREPLKVRAGRMLDRLAGADRVEGQRA